MVTQKTALLLIDWQMAFNDLAFWGPRCNHDAEKTAASLINECRIRDIAVWHVDHHSTALSSPLNAAKSGAKPMAFATVMNFDEIKKRISKVG